MMTTILDTSSPLAALQPPAFSGHWATARPNLDFNNGFLRPGRFSKGIDFKDVGPKKSSSDYFSFRPARGSSPTQSLAVDLSQNFHIDQSPQLPTPRRALFPSALLANRRSCPITPPIPSSSPGSDGDHMEFSPLPHKLPIRQVSSILLDVTSSSSSSSEPASLVVITDPILLPRFAESQPGPSQQSRPVEDRRMLSLARPTFRKAQSSGYGPPHRPRTSESYKSSFAFGNASTLARPPLESFAESPPIERKLAPSMSNPSFGASPVKSSSCGSPMASILPRRPPMGGRTRSGINRRSMSMQYNDSTRAVRAEKKRCCTTGTSSTSDLPGDEYKLRLPHTKPIDEVDALPRITRETLVDVLGGTLVTEDSDYVVIDCRFEYEYKGGHIDRAINFNDKEQLAQTLFEGTSVGGKSLIFHCEYSVLRAPLMAKFIRQRDRMVNQDSYPRLTYPEIYVLDGGYHGFFKEHPNHCFPRSYIEMNAAEHEFACELGMAKVKARSRAKLSRAQTYAFGQQPSMISLLPCPPAGTTPTIDAMDVDFNSPLELRTNLALEAPTLHPQLFSDMHTVQARTSGPRLPRRFDSY